MAITSAPPSDKVELDSEKPFIAHSAAMSTNSSLPSVISSPTVLDEKSIYASVQDGYSWAAKGNDSNYGHAVASAFGYSKEELTHVPTESNLGLSCGNPFAVAKIREGETVIDLGSGAGFDVFQAAIKVGPSGKVIGADMNKVDNLFVFCFFLCWSTN